MVYFSAAIKTKQIAGIFSKSSGTRGEFSLPSAAL